MGSRLQSLYRRPVDPGLSGDEATTSYNPATGEAYARVHQAGAAETEQAVTAAHNAYKSRADMVVSEREAVFLRAADVLAAKAKEITDVLIGRWKTKKNIPGRRGSAAKRSSASSSL